ncbi:MAG: hypothetical protein R6U00_05225 [Prochlorococcaceae cyanobacterium]
MSPQPQERPPLAPSGPPSTAAAVSPARGLLSRLRRLADLLMFEPVAAVDPGPYVHTAAIHTSADLTASLNGITQLSREQGFSRDPDTHYGDGGRSATYHVDHRDLPVSLTVNCHPLRQTVAIAVSGLDCDDTYRCFSELETALFGNC